MLTIRLDPRLRAADYDNDGDQDLVNANDFGQDRFYRVNADGTFTNVTDEAIGWDTHKGMNVEFGDYNNDGWLDLYVTNIWTKEYVKEGNQLYRNMGDGTFSDISFEANVYDAGWCWAGRFWDYDNDGDLDIIVANGYISGDPKDEYFTKLATSVTKPGFDPIEAQNWPMMGDSTFSGYEPSRVWRNEGNEVFTEVAESLGWRIRMTGGAWRLPITTMMVTWMSTYPTRVRTACSTETMWATRTTGCRLSFKGPTAIATRSAPE